MPFDLSRLRQMTPSVRTDNALLQAFVAGGDSAAFDELAHRHADLARRVATEVCPAAADEVAQDTLALLARKAATVAGRESAAGWVFETARRLALKARTAAARRAKCEVCATPPQPSTDPLDEITLRELRATVAEELAQLSDEFRLPLVLCYWDGESRLAAAARLGCSESTLKRRLNTARDRLAVRLARRGFAGSAVLAALTAFQARAVAAVPIVKTVTPVFAIGKVLCLVVVIGGIAALVIGIGVSDRIAPEPASDPAKSSIPPPLSPATPPSPAKSFKVPPLSPVVKRSSPSLQDQIPTASVKENSVPNAKEIAPLPRVKEYGTLRLTTKIAVKDGVLAWVEIDGNKEKVWEGGKTQVEMKLKAGSHAVRVVSVYKNIRTVVFESEIEVPANQVKEVPVEPKS